MQHIAIMKKSWNLIPKILSGEKTIESRWYKYKIAPWNKIKAGDIVYFKDSSEPVTAVAKVSKVLQFENLDEKLFNEIIDKYGEQIGIKNQKYSEYYQKKNYCILIFLKEAQKVEQPFMIDKTGYGNACAWMVVDDIEKLKR